MSIDRMVAEAEKTLGVGEPNYIQSWYNDRFGNPDGSRNWPWCNGAVTYWAHKSGNAKAVCFSDNGHFAYTVGHADAFKARGAWRSGTSGIRRGDIVFFDWNGTDNISAIDHVGLVTGVRPDGKVETIEGNISDTCARRVRTSFEIAGYGRPAYAAAPVPPPGGGSVKTYKVKAGDTLSKIAAAQKVPGGWEALYEANKAVIGDNPNELEIGQELRLPGTATPPPEPPAPPVVSTSVYFEDIGPRGTAAANKVIQAALNKFTPPVTVDGDYGPKTRAAYTEWQNHLGFYGPVAADGYPGITSATRLAAAYGFELKRRGSEPSTPPPSGDVANYLMAPEPAARYNRVTYSGKTVNQRTADLLRLAEKYSGQSIRLTQGSYNRGGVAASAGTHDGGGAVDIASSSRSLVLALRKAGFAAWLRTPAQGFSYHIHAVAIGDREASSGAAGQVQSYFNGRNGLANNGADDAERRWPNWADKYNR